MCRGMEPIGSFSRSCSRALRCTYVCTAHGRLTCGFFAGFPLLSVSARVGDRVVFRPATSFRGIDGAFRDPPKVARNVHRTGRKRMARSRCSCFPHLMPAVTSIAFGRWCFPSINRCAAVLASPKTGTTRDSLPTSRTLATPRDDVTFRHLAPFSIHGQARGEPGQAENGFARGSCDAVRSALPAHVLVTLASRYTLLDCTF
jgi:hypothetical protein